MDDLLTLLNLVMSFVLTWGAGLAIPLLLRFVILKKPVVKLLAFIFAGINFLLNLGLWIWIGMVAGSTTSKTHMVQYVMAIVSYIIMSKGYINPTKDKEPKPGKLEAKNLSFKDIIKK